MNRSKKPSRRIAIGAFIGIGLCPILYNIHAAIFHDVLVAIGVLFWGYVIIYFLRKRREKSALKTALRSDEAGLTLAPAGTDISGLRTGFVANRLQRDVYRRVRLATILLWITLSLNLVVDIISVCRARFLYYEVPSPHNIDNIAWTREHMTELLFGLSLGVMAFTIFFGWLITRIRSGSYAARLIGTIIAVRFLVEMPGRYFSDIVAIYDIEIVETVLLLNVLWLLYSHPGGIWFEKSGWKKKLAL